MTDIGKKIGKVAAMMRERYPMMPGTWAIELDEDGYEIGVRRDAAGNPQAFMHPDDLRAMLGAPW